MKVFYTVDMVSSSFLSSSKSQFFRKNVTLSEVELFFKPKTRPLSAIIPSEYDRSANPDMSFYEKDKNENLIQLSANDTEMAMALIGTTLRQVLRKRAEERQQLKMLDHNRKLRDQGYASYHRISFEKNFPTKRQMEDVKTVALSDGGFCCVFSNGTCATDGLPEDVLALIKTHHKKSNLKYVALGAEGQYFLSTLNGISYWNGCEKFSQLMRQNLENEVILASFGDFDTYFVLFKDGSVEWNGNISTSLTKIFQKQAQNVDYLWMSLTGVEYAVGYNGDQGKQRLPNWIPTHVKAIFSSDSSVKQFLVDELYETYFLRYS